MQPLLTTYLTVTRQQDRFVQQFERTPEYRRASEHFQKVAPTIDSVDALMKDRRALTVVLSAFQLEDKIDSRAFIKRIITEDPNDPASLARRLADRRYLQLATALQPLANGQKPFATQAGIDAVLKGFRTNEFEKAQGAQTEGMREALYFKRIAGSVTNTFQILADPALKEVARVALGLPKEFLMQDVGKQRSMIEARVKPEQWKDAAFIEKFTQRYLANAQIQQSQQTGFNNPILQLIPRGRGVLA